MQEKAFTIAANMLEAGETDLEMRDRHRFSGVPDMHVTARYRPCRETRLG